MSVPAFLRTWQFQVDQVVAPQGATLSTNQALMFALKQSTKGVGAWTDAAGAVTASSGNWDVRSSSDGVGGFGNNDGVDRWVTGANLIWAAAGTNHSWIVLRQTGIATNFEVCIDLSNALSATATIAVSFTAGFGSAALGTATARPTATDERVLISNASWGGPNGNTPQALHVLKTADGSALRVIVTRASNNGSGGWTVLFWGFELPVVSNAAWTSPSAAWAFGSSAVNPSSGLDTVANLSTAANTWSRTPGGTNFQSTWSGEATQQHNLLTSAYGSASGGQQNVSDVSREGPLFAVGLYSTTVNARGPNGVLVDIRIGLENISTAFGQANGRTYPDVAPLRQWAQFGDFVHPWNRSLPKVLT